MLMLRHIACAGVRRRHLHADGTQPAAPRTWSGLSAHKSEGQASSQSGLQGRSGFAIAALVRSRPKRPKKGRKVTRINSKHVVESRKGHPDETNRPPATAALLDAYLRVICADLPKLIMAA